MNFKKYINQDILYIFSANEFEEEHIINMKKVKIIIDNEHLRELSKKEYDGIYIGDILFFVKSEEFGKLPKVNQVLVFDGIPHTVFDAKNTAGVYEIILQKNVN